MKGKILAWPQFEDDMGYQVGTLECCVDGMHGHIEYEGFMSLVGAPRYSATRCDGSCCEGRKVISEEEIPEFVIESLRWALNNPE